MKMEYIVPFALFLHLCLGQALTVVVPPDSPAAIEVGQNVTLKANPTDKITAGTWNFGINQIIFWFPGREITSDQYENRTFFNTDDASLTLTSLQVDDSGTYALNAVVPNEIQLQFVLSVQVPISNVTMTVSDTNLTELNDTVTLNCSASGTPLWFQWINGTSVVTASQRVQFNDDSSVLTIDKVSRFDTLPFFCNVSNSISHDMSWKVSLNISYGPSNLTLEVAPYKMAYISGSNVVFTCSADSKPAASYEWLFKDTSLNKFGENLELTDLKMNETGQYTCLVHNSVTSRYEKISKSLNIVDPISAVAVNKVGRPPILNMTFTLSCDVTGPVDSIHWMMNDSYLSADNRISISSDNTTLTFTSIEMSDNGMYWCMAFNAVSNKTSHEYALTVNYGPEMPVISGPSIIATAANLMLSCSAASQPPSNFTWYFNDMVRQGPDYKVDSVSLSNSGNYTCSAHNYITNITKMVTKEVKVIHLISNAVIKITGNPPVDHKRFVLTCEAVGTVYERYWMMDGMTLNLNTSRMSLSDDNSMLTFDPVLTSDDGNYTCMASNPLNNDTSPMFSLKVNYGPKTPFITGPMQPVKAGSNVTLNCDAASEPPSNFTWYFKNMKESGSMYVINEATSSDSGNYTCVAMNDVTKQNSSTLKELVIIDPISAVMIMKGEPPILNMTFMLSCNVTGPVDSIHWMKNSDYLQTTEDDRISFSDGNKTLTFRPVMHSDDGDYKCSASNAVSNFKSTNFTLKVYYGPDNVTISGPSILPTGSNVTFTCDASSRPQSSISWFFNGNDVGMSSVYKKYSLSPVDSGEYNCTAHNNKTDHSSSVIKMLTVIDPISKVMVNEDNGPPILNKTFTLSCNVTGPLDSIHWMVNSSSYLQSNDRISFSNENKTLTFKHVDHSDNGNYQCVAMNAVSKLNSPEYMFMVNYGPWDTVITGSQKAKSGSNVTFHCSATSRPPSAYSWYHNELMVGEGAQLELIDLTFNQSGEYTCKAHNNKTSMNSSASTDLQVIAPLTVVTIETDDQLPILGRSFKCNCSANSETTSIYWMKNGTYLSWDGTVSFSEDNVTMTIDSVMHDDSGEYQCTAQNDVSEMTSSVYNFMVNFGPKNVSISGPELAETGANVTFNCSATSWPPSGFSWYFNDSWVANGSSYTTETLALEGSRKYTCMAHNKVTGLISSASIELKIINAPTPIVVKPNPAIPMDSEDFSLYCDIAGSYNSIKWYRDSRPLIFNNTIMPTISNDSTTVSFKPLKRANDGKYQCVVENAVTQHYSEAYDLRAVYGPSEVVISMTTEIPLTLTCKADSQPPSEYEWIIDDKQEGNSSSIELTLFDVLALENITCKATNPLTNETVTATFEMPDLNAAPPLQSRVDLTLTVLLALSLCLLGNRFY